MTSTIDINSFEHFFDEASLKRGLYLFQKNKLKDIEKFTGGEFYFAFKTKPAVELHLKKKENKIVKYKCSCRKNNCEHLCAAIFFLAGDKLSLEEKLIRKFKKQKAGKQNPFPAYCGKLHILIRKNFRINVFEDSRENDKKAFEIIKDFSSYQKNINPVFLHLAILSEFCEFFNFRKNLTDEVSNNLLSSSVEALKELPKTGLTETEKNAWITAAGNSMKNNKRFNSGVFNFLIPYAVNITAEINVLEELKMLCGKRKLKLSFKHYLDMQLVARFQIQLKESALFKKDRAELHRLTPELSIAKAELKFCMNKISQGCKILSDDYEKIKKTRSHHFINYLEYLINRMRELKNDKNELFFIKEIIIHDHLIPVKYLTRMKELLPEPGRDKYVTEMIIELKKQQPEIYFDKLCQLLESEGRLDELVVELSKQTNKFWLINKIAIKKLPAYDKLLLNVYMKHLVSILYEARESYHQKQIFEMAKIYFDKLPKKTAINFVSDILEKISKNNFIYEHLKKYIESHEA